MNAPALLAVDLPESLVDVVAAIGLPATLKLVERFGGIRLYIPRPEHIECEHPLTQAIGLEAAKKLAAIWLGERPPVPRALYAIRRARDRALRLDYLSMSAAKVALKYQLTERWVYVIAATQDETQDDEGRAGQADLF